MDEVHELRCYHITMFVCREQEDSIRSMFKDKNWPCWLKAVSAEKVTAIIQSGFTDVFTVLSDGQRDVPCDTAIREVKLEINVEAEVHLLNEINLEASCEEQQHSDNKSNTSDSECNTKINVKAEVNPSDEINIEASSEEPKNSDNKSDILDSEHNMSDNSLQVCKKESQVILDNKNTSSDNMQQMSDSEDTECDYMNADNDLDSSSSDNSKDSTDELSNVTTEKKDNKQTESCGEQRSSRRKRKATPQEQSSSKNESYESNGETKQTKFRCSMCDMYLASRPSLIRHCQRRHGDEWYEFKCKDCPCMFKKLEELWKHRNEVKHEPPRVQPKFSEKKSLSPEELEQLGHLKCNACGKILPSRRLLRRHFYSDHRECMPGPSCAVCGVEFKTRQELWKHKREMKHNDSLSLLQTYQCEECGKILTGGYHSFKLHQKFACKDTEEAPCSKCDICGGMFKSQTHVQQHKNRTHIDLPVVCDICGTVCKNKHALNSHKRRHDEKNKKFACSNCGKAFLTNILLQMHIRTHTKEKPFKCPLCDYRCAIKQNIQKHSVNVHKTQVKCTDIVTISGNRLHEASKEIAQHENKVRNGKTSNSNRKNLKIPPEGKLLSDDMASIPSDRMSDFNKISYNLNGTESMPSDRVLLPNVKTFVKNGTAENTKPLTLDRPFLSNDKGVNFSANRNKSYPFNDIESAYDLTMCRQNAISGSGHDAGKVTVNNENPLANLTTIKETSAGSYAELINCTVNPMSYALANLDPSHYHHQWGNPSNR